jgi:1,4-dihydroxy-2-naphthoate octaprenyltransferase
MDDAGSARARDQQASEAPAERGAGPVSRPAVATQSPASFPMPRSSPGGRVAGWARAAQAGALPCTVGPVFVAGALLWSRGAPVSPELLLLTALAAAAVLAGAGLLDTYLEHVRTETAASGRAPRRGTRSGGRARSGLLESGIYPLDTLRAAGLLFAAGAGLGVPLALAGGWQTLLLGVAGLVAAFLYSATSFALKRLPLGELVVFLTLGPGVVAFTILVQRQAVTPLDWAMGSGLGLFAAGVVEAANLRAIAPEIRDGRLTLVRIVGQRRGRWVFAGCLVGAYTLVLGASLPPGAPHGALATLFSLPAAALPLTGGLRARNAAPLDLVVRGSVRAYATFAFWLLTGLLLGVLLLRLQGVAGA